ncbi:MAG: hypothetical protein R3F48_03105 [Candidatus Zixiibacteriota bacterium]
MRQFLHVLLFLIGLLCITPACFAQAKIVSTPSYVRTDAYASTRLIGMGGAAVAVTDGNDPYFNPAQISYPLNKYRFRINSSPGLIDWYESSDGSITQNQRNISIIAAILRANRAEGKTYNLNVGVGYYRDKTVMTSSYLVIHPSGGEELVTSSSHYTSSLIRASVGIGVERVVSMSCGASVNIFEEVESAGYRKDVDVGVIFGLPEGIKQRVCYSPEESMFNIYPSLGFTMQQMALKIEEETITPIKRFGLAAKFSWDYHDGRSQLSKLYIMPTYETLSQYDTMHKFGLEVGYHDALQLRYGRRGTHTYENRISYGVSLNSRGIARFLNKSERSLLYRANLSLHYAYIKPAYVDDTWSYFDITLELGL